MRSPRTGGARNRVAVIMTCFNRRVKTLACIDAVLAQADVDDVTLDFFVTDDASRDGTADALIGRHERIRMLKGNGSLFWNGGMRMAWADALRGDYDFFLWINDDTFLYPSALRSLVDTYDSAVPDGAAAIVVGSTDDGAGQISYGGELQRNWLLPLTLTRIVPRDVAQPCDTFNGNCVLVSRAAATVLGNLDCGFVHAMGDTDYGLRARRAGVPMWVMPGYAGRCVNDHNVAGGYGDVSLPLTVRWEKAMGPKALPWRPWRLLCQRHAGWLWPIFWSWPYMKIVATACYLGARRRIGRAVT